MFVHSPWLLLPCIRRAASPSFCHAKMGNTASSWVKLSNEKTRRHLVRFCITAGSISDWSHCSPLTIAGRWSRSLSPHLPSLPPPPVLSPSRPPCLPPSLSPASPLTRSPVSPPSLPPILPAPPPPQHSPLLLPHHPSLERCITLSFDTTIGPTLDPLFHVHTAYTTQLRTPD